MLASQINALHLRDAPFFSLEFYPPLKDQSKNIEEFFETLNYLKQANPLFIDITWSRRNDPGNIAKRNSSSAIAVSTGDAFGKHRTMLHICCNDHTKEETLAHVEQAIGNGIRNIMALRGDDLPEAQNGGIALEENGSARKRKHHAINMVRWIREMERAKHSGESRITVAVAGHIYPPTKTESYAQCMEHLKNKVDAGADFIVTQFFLEPHLFDKFRTDCRSKGIFVPILPGILLFKSAAALKKIADLSNVLIPAHILRTLNDIAGDPIAVQNFAVQLAFDTCRHIFSNGQATGIHLFTLNQRDMCGKLLKRLGFWPTINGAEMHLNGCSTVEMNGISHKMMTNGIAKENGDLEEEETVVGMITKHPMNGQNGHFLDNAKTRKTA